MRAFYSNLYQAYLIKNTENLYLNKILLKNQQNNQAPKDSTLFYPFCLISELTGKVMQTDQIYLIKLNTLFGYIIDHTVFCNLLKRDFKVW